MTRLKHIQEGASTSDARVTEMVNGLLVSKLAEKEPIVIDLQQ